MRSKVVQGINSITCEKRVRPEYMTVPRLKSPNRVRNYRQNPKRCSSRHQKKHQRNPYIAALFCKITLAEPDSTGRNWEVGQGDQVRGHQGGLSSAASSTRGLT